MNPDLKDKIVLITGASGGIGAACARAFAEEGARLALHANTNIPAVENLIEELGVDALPVQADLTDERHVDEIFTEIAERIGPVDVVVANAGKWPPEPTPITEMTLERWNATIATNQTSVFLTARAFFRQLAEHEPQNANLVVVGSTAAVFGEENHAEYAASKAAVVYGLTRTLKNEIVRIVPDGRVNAVCPGWTITPMAKDELENAEKVAPILQTRAHQRVARPEDIAHAVLYLASDKLARHLTGQILTVAGGMEGRLLHRYEDTQPENA